MNKQFLSYSNNMDEEMRTLWCGNLSEKVTEEILYELFLQVCKFIYLTNIQENIFSILFNKINILKNKK